MWLVISSHKQAFLELSVLGQESIFVYRSHRLITKTKNVTLALTQVRGAALRWKALLGAALENLWSYTTSNVTFSALCLVEM